MSKKGNKVAVLKATLDLLQEELRNVETQCQEEWQAQACARFASRARKRAEVSDAQCTANAIAGFLAANEKVRVGSVELDPFIEHNAREFISRAFERFNARADPSLIQIPYDPRFRNQYWRFGPGASNGVSGKHTAEKITGSWSCTAPCENLVHRIRDENVYLRSLDKESAESLVTRVRGSRLETVQKNEETDRTIGIEPLGNMAIQLAEGQYVEAVLRSLGLDITKQEPKNKRLAWSGSLNGSIATVDLKDASNMYSIDLCKRLLPRGLFLTMMLSRSPEMDIPGEGWVQLYMMSSMGNGFTFPIMTLINVALVFANRLKLGKAWRGLDWSETAVYGDDIIVPVDEYSSLVGVLQSAGLVVNLDKSYASGPFRESCGGDYWMGKDITPVYIKSLAARSDIYVAINLLMEWCAKVGVILPRTIQRLVELLDGEVYFVPEWHGNDAGFRCSEVPHRYKYLQAKQKRVPLSDERCLMMLACGGYVSQGSLSLVGVDPVKDSKRVREILKKSRKLKPYYVPRQSKTRYKVKKARLPEGYRDGSDPLSRNRAVSAYVESYAFLVRL